MKTMKGVDEVELGQVGLVRVMIGQQGCVFLSDRLSLIIVLLTKKMRQG